MGFVSYIQAALTLTLVVVTILVFAAVRTMNELGFFCFSCWA